MKRRLPVLTVLAVGALVFTGCSASTTEATNSLDDTDPSDASSGSPQAEQRSALTEPSVEISYVLHGERMTAFADLGVSGCSTHAFTAMGDDRHSASVILPTEGEIGRINANVLDDALVAYVGTGKPDFSANQATTTATVVQLSGTATVVDLPEGDTRSIGEIDLSDGVEVPATLTATLMCSL